MTPCEWSMLMEAPPFNAMGEEVVRKLVKDRPPQCLRSGAQIFMQGDPAESFFFVFDGRVKFYRQRLDGDEVVVTISGGGETFAEIAMFIGGIYPLSAEAISKVRLIRIDGAALRGVIEQRPLLAFDLLAAATDHLHFLFDQIEQLNAQPTPQRIADFLLELPRDGSVEVEIMLPYGKALIAKRLGMTPESFSRGLTKLRPLGVSVERNKVRIANVPALADYAGRQRAQT